MAGAAASVKEPAVETHPRIVRRQHPQRTLCKSCQQAQQQDSCCASASHPSLPCGGNLCNALARTGSQCRLQWQVLSVHAGRCLPTPRVEPDSERLSLRTTPNKTHSVQVKHSPAAYLASFVQSAGGSLRAAVKVQTLSGYWSPPLPIARDSVAGRGQRKTCCTGAHSRTVTSGLHPPSSR